MFGAKKRRTLTFLSSFRSFSAAEISVMLVTETIAKRLPLFL
jgi:hypothetical protein